MATVLGAGNGRSTAPASSEILQVRGLQVDFATDRGWATVVDDVSFTLRSGETLGIVGESGSGKTVTSLAVMGLIPQPPGRIAKGSVVFDGTDITKLSNRQVEDIRGKDIAMVFQEPMSSLNPAFTVGNQISETIRRHQGVSRRQAWKQALAMLDLVGIPNASRRATAYPHEFSGGMLQRVVIAIALSCNPRLLIADEPTTALDVTVQAQVLELLKDMQRERHMAVLFITHDLGVVADICDRVLVMYAGRVIEEGGIVATFRAPVHPYTEGLLSAVPRLEGDQPMQSIPGSTPPPWAMPEGCRFHPRCEYATDVCLGTEPELEVLDDGRRSRCRRIDELTLRGSNG